MREDLGLVTHLMNYINIEYLDTYTRILDDFIVLLVCFCFSLIKFNFFP